MKKIMLILVVLFSFCGCMESRELKERTIIEAVGIDKENGQYHLIFQQYQPESGTGKSGDSSGKSKPVESQGRIVFGEEMAREGILQELHYFNGENEISPSTTLVIAEGSAKELITAQAESEGNRSVLRDILVQGQRNGVIGKSTIMNVMKRLVEDYPSPYLPVISVDKNEEESVFKITGMAVFDRNKMVDILPIEKAKGILWVNDEIERALLVVEQEDVGILSAEVQKSKTKVDVTLKDGQPCFFITIKCSAQLIEVIGSKNGTIDKSQQLMAEQRLEQEMGETIAYAIERCFLNDRCDVFRFCDRLRNQEPSYWNSIKGRWQEVMPACEIQISVDCQLSKTGQQAMG